jgi:hypothetical protein
MPVMAGGAFFCQSSYNTFMCKLSCVKLLNHFDRVIRQRPELPDWLKKSPACHAKQMPGGHTGPPLQEQNTK